MYIFGQGTFVYTEYNKISTENKQKRYFFLLQLQLQLQLLLLMADNDINND